MTERPIDDLPAGSDIAADIRSTIRDGQSIVFVSGNFNVVHPGHVRLLRFAREAGDFLVVGVNPDSELGVSVPAELRLEAVRSIKVVDYAFVLPRGATAAIEA
ncbi:MAG: adenylyltransferase/cytidyltransferase family protein, partial [Rhodospirillales bacterium]